MSFIVVLLLKCNGIYLIKLKITQLALFLLFIFFSFSFNPDPRVRNTFWTLSIGGAFTAMPVWTVCQPAVQRFQAAKTMKESRKYDFFV